MLQVQLSDIPGQRSQSSRFSLSIAGKPRPSLPNPIGLLGSAAKPLASGSVIGIQLCFS